MPVIPSIGTITVRAMDASVERRTEAEDWNALGSATPDGTGKLHDEDYKQFVPVIDAALGKEERVRLLAQFHEFRGWDLHALWDDIRFAATHCTKLDRIALVGEKKWEAWMAKVCKPFTMAKIEYFDASKIEDAKKWLGEGL